MAHTSVKKHRDEPGWCLRMQDQARLDAKWHAGVWFLFMSTASIHKDKSTQTQRPLYQRGSVHQGTIFLETNMSLGA